jgi:hypothetical protein
MGVTEMKIGGQGQFKIKIGWAVDRNYCIVLTYKYCRCLRGHGWGTLNQQCNLYQMAAETYGYM